VDRVALLALAVLLTAVHGAGAVVSPHFILGAPYCETRVGIGPTGSQLPLLGDAKQRAATIGAAL